MPKEFIEILDSLSNLGGLVILAALFIYMFFQDKNDRKEEKSNNNAIMKELSVSNNNVAESLNLLRTSIDINTNEFRQHDERAIKQFNIINEKLIRIEERGK